MATRQLLILLLSPLSTAAPLLLQTLEKETMEGLPLLPGLSFSNPAKSRFNLPQRLRICQGVPVVVRSVAGIGGDPLDSQSILNSKSEDPVRYDPRLTYGRSRSSSVPVFRPHFVMYDKKNLTFQGYFRQELPDHPDEKYRIRKVNIIYYVEDDTMSVYEPPVENSGLPQGKLVNRAKQVRSPGLPPKFWHWKDLDLNMELTMFGTTYHICTCDNFTKQFMKSQGVELSEEVDIPPDPYTLRQEQIKLQASLPVAPVEPELDKDRTRKLLQFDGVILGFEAYWDDRDSEAGELRPLFLQYYMADDTLEVTEPKIPNSGRDPNYTLLGKTRVPKNWKGLSPDFPCYLENVLDPTLSYYGPRDLIVGQTIFIMGRRLLLTDCAKFAREYYRQHFKIEQPAAIKLETKPPRVKHIRPLPRYEGLGTVEDSLQSWYHFLPKPPKRDMVRYLNNLGKKLRYEAELDTVWPEDAGRRFVIEYRLFDGTVLIQEAKVANSGFLGGRFLEPTLVPLPGTDPSDPQYYTPVHFTLGSVIVVGGFRFRITGVDLGVYRYMAANPEKFSEETVAAVVRYLLDRGHLTEDVRDRAMVREQAATTRPLVQPPPDPKDLVRPPSPPPDDCAAEPRHPSVQQLYSI